VKVYLDDGSHEAGDLVIGADGVHSLTRKFMWDHADRTEPGSIPLSDKTFASTEYKAIFGVSDPLRFPSLGPADLHVCFGEGASKLVFTQPDAVMWAVIYKDKYSQPPKPFRPDETETEEVVNRFKHLNVTEDITFEDLWVCKTRGGILNMEEGILESWHAGRIVLVGDAAHKVSSSSWMRNHDSANRANKMTADIGMGANMGIESAVALANVLQSAVAAHPNQEYHPTQSELSALFTEYQSKRYARVKRIMELSGSTTRMRSYQSLWKRIWVSRIATLPIMQRIMAKKMVAGLATAPKLQYANVRTLNENLKGWRLGQDQVKLSSGNGRVMGMFLLCFLGIALSHATASGYMKIL
jgi:FAD dependent monooxygenase